MKQVCTQCNRTAYDGNLWCQEPDCPIGRMPPVFSYGEPFGDFEIAKNLAVLRSSALYAAVRAGEKVLLKIAHAGCQERLKRESEFLQGLQQQKLTHPMLPDLMPAHRETDLAYGKIAYHGKLKYFCVYAYREGDLLRELLLKNPQPWYQHAGWIALSITDVIGFIQDRQQLHLALSPESILVRYDKEDIPRITLVDLGAMTNEQSVPTHWDINFVPTAYAAPELLGTGRSAGSTTDIYGIGLILYEMLAGHPAFRFELRTEEAIRYDILHTDPLPIKRADLTELPIIARQATQRRPHMRMQNAAELADNLLRTIPLLPKEKPERRINWRAVAVILGAAIVISLLLATAIMLSDLPSF